MCLLIYKPANASIPFDFLEGASRNNSDGAGLAVADGKKLIIRKGHNWGATNIAENLEAFKEHPAIVHFRFATHGNVDVSNTHPFQLDNDWCAAHNGVISIKTGENESDTRAFLREHVKPLLKTGNSLTDKDIIASLEKDMGLGNKMTFLSKRGEIGIANEDQGHWKDGVWYSNHSYYSWTQQNCGAVKYLGAGSSGYRQEWWAEDMHDDDAAELQSLNEYYSEMEKAEEKQKPGMVIEVPEPKWLQMNTDSLMCDHCGTYIEGRFWIEQHQGIVFCNRCSDKF